MTQPRLTLKTLNRALADAGYAERLVKGEGYWYFIEGEAFDWYSSSVPVYRLNDLSIEQWIEWRNYLANHNS